MSENSKPSDPRNAPAAVDARKPQAVPVYTPIRIVEAAADVLRQMQQQTQHSPR